MFWGSSFCKACGTATKEKSAIAVPPPPPSSPPPPPPMQSGRSEASLHASSRWSNGLKIGAAVVLFVVLMAIFKGLAVLFAVIVALWLGSKLLGGSRTNSTGQRPYSDNGPVVDNSGNLDDRDSVSSDGDSGDDSGNSPDGDGGSDSD